MKKPRVPTESVCFRLPAEQVAVLKRTARRRAIDEDKDIAYTDLCREAIVRMFPLEEERILNSQH